MRYMMLYQPDTESTAPPTAEHLARMGKLIEDMTAAGVLLDHGALQHSGAGVRVRKDGSTVTVTDGPFSESKELIAGYAVVEARDRAHAIELARHFLEIAGGGQTEVRPMQQAPHVVPA
jgi:hypothetical protein